MKVKKKPIEINAFLSEGNSKERLSSLKTWVESFGDSFDSHFKVEDTGANVFLKVNTLEGASYNVGENDLILRGVRGEYYPIKKHIFDETYEITQK